MQALWQAALEPVNIFYTILLGIIILYWLSVFIGALDLSAFDFDLDVDVDIDADIDLDVDVDADVDADTNAGNALGWFAGALHFFNFGKVPFMVLMSFVVLTAWSLSILLNDNIGHGRWWFALAMFIPIVFLSLIAGKILSTPFVPIFKALDNELKTVDFIGMICEIRIPASFMKSGQAVVQINGYDQILSVKTENEDIELKRGENARIIRKTEDNQDYIVRREVVLP